ncbi:MAG: ATP-binding protein [Ktedonobacteraceae bacterium]|nr:ATP-binding protein [Ktedonobacteraceae bacterium]
MDGVQFGRWFQARRHKCGFASQRVLVGRVTSDPALQGLAISEDFLARLEAGLLVHPFRGRVRQRVLALAELLCKTPRELNAYLHAAELSELDAGEATRIALLRQRFQVQHHQRALLLPPRPARLVGRETLVAQLVGLLRQMHSGLCVVTGMPGVGKSALAAEVVYVLASDQPGRLRTFSDGIMAFPCTGYRGKSGLLALLDDIMSVFDPHPSQRSSDRGKKPETSYSHEAMPDDSDLTKAMNRVRLMLANSSLLILLDDLDAQFPLQQAMGALLGQSQQALSPYVGDENGRAHRVVLATSRSLFSPAIVNQHVRVEPLEAEIALDYFVSFIQCSLNAEDVVAAREIVAAVGYLPLAIEMASSVAMMGMPLPLLAHRLAENPLIATLDTGHDLHDRLGQAFAPLNAAMHRRYALLAASGILSFGLESAAALCVVPVHSSETCAENELHLFEKNQDVAAQSQVHLADVAFDLAYFARHSLVDQGSPAPTVSMPVAQKVDRPAHASTYFHFHPILRAYASRHLCQLKPEDIEMASGNLQTFAYAYIERYAGESRPLMHERDVLWAVFLRTVQDGCSAHIVQFAQGLAPISCRLHGIENGKYLFQSAIQASQSLRDRYHERIFLWCLGRLYCQRGDFALASQTWLEALDIPPSRKFPVQAWLPLLGLAHLAHLHHDEETAEKYIEQYVHYCLEDNDVLRSASLYALLARYARLQGHKDAAYLYVDKGMSMLPPLDFAAVASPVHEVDAWIRLELARVTNDFAASQEYTESAATYLEQEEDYYFLADLLLDQAYFAQSQAQYADMHRLVNRVVQASTYIEMPHLLQCGMQLLQSTAEARLTVKGLSHAQF